ncbi:MAG: hypothetical protein NT052_02035 [Candidatus Shapirobacteria bacterium]|nr:hypothetical protein [Candidatus Shapirobacteria bacterium]
MKKEILIAIVIGFVLGLIITFGIWTANKSLKNESSTQKTAITENGPITNEEEKIFLKILSPDDNSLVNQNKIKITGKTFANVNIAIISEKNENILQSDEQGQFTQEVSLVSGSNEVKISAFDNEGNEAQKTLNLVYSTAEI